jgi:hypothetical protein
MPTAKTIKKATPPGNQKLLQTDQSSESFGPSNGYVSPRNESKYKTEVRPSERTSKVNEKFVTGIYSPSSMTHKDKNKADKNMAL